MLCFASRIFVHDVLKLFLAGNWFLAVKVSFTSQR